MKKNDNSFTGKVIDALDKIGLTAGELAIVQDYLDSDPRDESILDAITPRDLSVLPRDGFTSCYKLAGQLSDKKARDNDSLSAFAEIAFAVGQWSAYLMFSNYYSTLYNSVRGIISDEKYVAIAAGYGASCFMGNRGRLAQDTVWLYAEDHPRTVIKALDYCGAAGGRTRLFAEMALFCQLYNKYPTFVEQGGIEDTLALFDTEYIPYVLQAFADSMLGLTAQETARIVDYVKSDISPVLPLDSDISSLCEKAGVERIDANLPAVSALLLCERSDICARMLRIYTLCDLSCVFDIACHSFRHSDVDALLHRLESSPYFSSGDTGRYFLYAVHYKLDGTAKRIYGRDRDCLDKALDMANAQNVIDIIEKLRRLDPEEYKRKIDPAGEYAERLREKTARGISELVSGGREELYDFITGKSDAGKLLPCLDTYKTELSMSYVTYLSTAAEQVLKGDAINGRLRLVKLLGGYYYDVLKDLRTENRYNSKISYQEFERLFDDLDMYALPRGLQYDLAAGMYDSCYSDESKASLRDCMCRVIEKRLAQDTGTAAEDLSKCGAVVRSCAVSVYAGDAERYKKELLSYAQDTSKLVRTELVGAAARQNGWDSDIIAMLGSKKSAERETAVDIMIARGAEKYTGQLAQALEKEKSAKLRSRIQEALSVTDNTDGKALSERQTARDIIANLLKGGKKRTLDWLFASPMPEVRSISGESTDTDALQALMLAYSSMPRPGVSEDAKIIAAGLNAADLGAAARETLARWLDSGADAKKKWVLYFASIHGGDAAAQTIISNINQWPLQSRGAIAAEAVNALALSPAPSALMTVDSLSRKCKFKQVKSAAQKALDFAAQQLGITSEQLADRIVPDLGFDTSMTRVFDYGPRNFTVRLTPALDLIITDQTGKRVKNLPAVGQKDDTEIAAKSAEQFKLLKKQLKAVTATQKLRLELALSSGRQWTAEAWRQLFVNNPVMRQFAIGLIWGTYDGSQLIDTFRYMEDGSFNTVDEDEYQLPDSAVIGLVHPIELDKDALDGWKQQLEDYEITQPIEQLGRKVFTITDEEREADSLDRFGGVMLNGLSLSGKLLGMGWYRGSVEDAGMYYCYYRENIAEGVSAVMRFSGSYVGDQDGTVTVYNALFYKAGTVQYGSYVYDDVKPQDRIKLAGITPRCFSETILQLEKATASGSDRDEKWREDMGARFR